MKADFVTHGDCFPVMCGITLAPAGKFAPGEDDGDRRAKFMRSVGDELVLPTDHVLEVVERFVEDSGKVAEFRALRANIDPLGNCAARNARCRPANFLNRLESASNQTESQKRKKCDNQGPPSQGEGKRAECLLVNDGSRQTESDHIAHDRRNDDPDHARSGG